jgi:hypothetical protein
VILAGKDESFVVDGPFAAKRARRYGPPPFWEPCESVADIFDEVEEEIRSERVQRFFARYGWAILVLVLAIVVGIGVWRWREWHMARADQAAAAEYLIATNELAAAPAGKTGDNERQAALAMLENLSAHAPAGYAVLARLRGAAALAAGGNTQAALHLYDSVASDPSADPLLRSLATILWAQRQIGTGDPQILKARLEPLAVPDNPWRPLAEQEIALLDIREKQPEEAKKILRSLANDLTATPSVRDTAALLLDHLGS